MKERERSWSKRLPEFDHDCDPDFDLVERDVCVVHVLPTLR